MPDNVHGKDYDGNVRTDVEDRGDIENRCYIYAATWGFPFPDFGPRCTLKNLD